MLADYFSKLLQGKSFYDFWDALMGWKHIDSLLDLTASSNKERVENVTKMSKIEPVKLSKIILDEIVSSKLENDVKSNQLPLFTSTESKSPKTVTWADVVKKDCANTAISV